MAERQYRTLTKRTVDRLSVNGKDAIFWDRDLPGFGVRVYPRGTLPTRRGAEGRARRASRLGPFGGGHSPPRAHRMPPQRNPRSSLGSP